MHTPRKDLKVGLICYNKSIKNYRPKVFLYAYYAKRRGACLYVYYIGTKDKAGTDRE